MRIADIIEQQSVLVPDIEIVADLASAPRSIGCQDFGHWDCTNNWMCLPLLSQFLSLLGRQLKIRQSVDHQKLGVSSVVSISYGKVGGIEGALADPDKVGQLPGVGHSLVQSHQLEEEQVVVFVEGHLDLYMVPVLNGHQEHVLDLGPTRCISDRVVDNIDIDDPERSGVSG